MAPTDGISNWERIEPPVIQSPIAGSLLNYLLGFNVQLGPFISATNTQSATDWEIRTAPNGGGTLVFASVNDLTALLVKTIPALTLGLGQTYYIRARFRAADGTLSAWSADVVIQT